MRAAGPSTSLGGSLGGILAALSVAKRCGPPVHTISVIAAPFDLHRMRLRGTHGQLAPMAELSGGFLQAALAQALTTPVVAPIERGGMRLLALPQKLRYPATLLPTCMIVNPRPAEATEAVKRRLRSYTGRSIGEIYARFIGLNELDERPAELHGEFHSIWASWSPIPLDRR